MTSPYSLRTLLLSTSLVALAQLICSATAALPDGFVEAFQFIATQGDPSASSGTLSGTQWGLWTMENGADGVALVNYTSQVSDNGNVAPGGWKSDPDDWWLDQKGLIMEAPKFPMPAGKYVVSGDRTVTTVLTIGEPSADGVQSWSLEKGTLNDVTHLPSRASRYDPVSAEAQGTCLPSAAHESDFPVSSESGGKFPEVEGCIHEEYAVSIIIGLEKEDVESV